MRYSNHDKQSRNYIARDYGAEPLVINIDKAAKQNPNFRTSLWTGSFLQVTLMSIPSGGEIGLENHPDTDQFLRIEDGCGFVLMGNSKEKLNYQMQISNNFAVFIPAGTWHNIINIGSRPLKIYSIYSPPQHPFGTVQKTNDESEKAENS